MTLLQKQIAFTRLIPRLIDHCFEKGFEVVLGEAYRPQVTADAYAAQGIGIKNSLHRDKLAIDISLFKDGQLLTSTASYEPIGVFWESLGTLECPTKWGGRFNDGNHFSVSWQGRR